MRVRTTRWSPSGAAEYSLPLNGWPAPQSAAVGQTLVLGEDGVAFATNQTQVLAFDLATDAVNWTWQPPQGPVEMIMATAGNGLVAKNRDDNTGLETVVRLDSLGQPTTESWSNQAIQYAAANLWYGSGSTDSIISLPVPWPNSIWPSAEKRGKRSSKPKVRVEVLKVCEDFDRDLCSNIPDFYILEKVNTGIAYWQMNAGILIDWDHAPKNILRCARDVLGCGVGAAEDILAVHEVTLSELIRRFPPQELEFQILFVELFSLPTSAVSETHGYTVPQIRNSKGVETFVFIRNNSDAILVAAHEIGHVFGLAHLRDNDNLMCGGTFIYPCVSEEANQLKPDQILKARINAGKLAYGFLP